MHENLFKLCSTKPKAVRNIPRTGARGKTHKRKYRYAKKKMFGHSLKSGWFYYDWLSSVF